MDQTGRVFETKEDTKHISPWPRYKAHKRLHFRPSSLIQPITSPSDWRPHWSTLVWRGLCALYTTVCLLAEMLVLAWLSGFHCEASNTDVAPSKTHILCGYRTHTMFTCVFRLYMSCMSFKCLVHWVMNCLLSEVFIHLWSFLALLLFKYLSWLSLGHALSVIQTGQKNGQGWPKRMGGIAILGFIKIYEAMCREEGATQTDSH